MSSTAPLLLQLCPNDHPPFRDICAFHAAAARELGWRTRTVLLAPPHAEPDADFAYLDADRPRTQARRLRECVAAGPEPHLVLCHRHRAYRTWRATGLRARAVLVVAHEFGYFRSWRRRADWWLGARGARVARDLKIAGVSEPVREELARTVADALVLPNGIDLPRADRDRVPRAEARRRLELPAAGFQIGVLGRLHPKKAPGLALEGFRNALPQMPDARLVFIGDGELAGELRAAASGLPVTFAGFVADGARLLGALDLLLLPSGSREAFGMVALEAMTAGVPVLCASVPGPRFVVGEAGRYFRSGSAGALADALVDAYLDWQRGELDKVAGTARGRVETLFSVSAAATRLNTIAAAAPQ